MRSGPGLHTRISSKLSSRKLSRHNEGRSCYTPALRLILAYSATILTGQLLGAVSRASFVTLVVLARALFRRRRRRFLVFQVASARRGRSGRIGTRELLASRARISGSGGSGARPLSALLNASGERRNRTNHQCCHQKGR